MSKLGRFKMLAVAAISAIALAASIAVAQTVTTNQDNGQGARPEWRGRRGGDHKGMRGMRAGGFFRGLNLTDDQKAKMKQIRESFAQTNKPLRDQLRAMTARELSTEQQRTAEPDHRHQAGRTGG